MSLSTAFPSVSPSLNLNFIRNNRLDPRITYTRSTTATYVGSDGYIKTAAINEPRFEYDPVSLAPRGLLLEGPRTNLILYSDQIGNGSAWGVFDSTITANNAIAPDGTLNADKLVASSTVIPYISTFGISITSGSTYTYSIFVKPVEVTLISMLLYGTDFGIDYANPSASFNLSTGAITAQTTSGATITNFGNGWWRISITQTATATNASAYNQMVRFANAPTAGQGLYVWGAQVEEAFFPSSYIQTTSAQVTRAADAMAFTDTNFTQWYNQAGGAFVISSDTFKADNTANTTYSRIFNLSDGSSTSRYTLFYNTTGGVSMTATGAGFNQSDSNSGVASKTTQKVGVNIQANNSFLTHNGVQAGSTETAAVVLNYMNNLTFFKYGTSSDEVNYGWGHIQYLLYYQEPLTVAQLRTLTK
jgi:hypothetical protein